MTKRRNVNDQGATLFPEISSDGDLSLRLEKISEQTGMSTQSLLQKWILQEETLIGLMRRGEEQAAKVPTIVTDAQNKKTESAQPDTGKSQYRKELTDRAKKLKKDGTTLKKIAEIFNDEQIPTVSGTGKWYASSVTNLFKSKK